LIPPPENVTFFHSKLLLYSCKFHNVNDEHLDIIISQILLISKISEMIMSKHADDATILISDQLQADSVLQLMPLLLYRIPIVAKDRGVDPSDELTFYYR